MGVFSGDWAEDVSISMWSVDGVVGGFPSAFSSSGEGVRAPLRVELFSSVAMCS